MGNADALRSTSLALAIGVAMVAAALALRLWWDRRTRGDLPALDRRHFFVQDVRRILGIVLLAYAAFGVYVGSRLPLFVLEPRDGAGRGPSDVVPGAVVQAALETHPNRRFLVVWLGVFSSLVVLLGLALIDWISTRRYAQRRRRELNRERAEILRATLRHRPADENGWSNGPPIDVA